jgi:GTPase Era involved in 16S rRNA processing
LNNVEKDYQIVGIIGVQNSGKSTLLNNLFGTKFECLQQSMGERTTLGIWTSLDK